MWWAPQPTHSSLWSSWRHTVMRRADAAMVAGAVADFVVASTAVARASAGRTAVSANLAALVVRAGSVQP